MICSPDYLRRRSFLVPGRCTAATGRRETAPVGSTVKPFDRFAEKIIGSLAALLKAIDSLPQGNRHRKVSEATGAPGSALPPSSVEENGVSANCEPPLPPVTPPTPAPSEPGRTPIPRRGEPNPNYPTVETPIADLHPVHPVPRQNNLVQWAELWKSIAEEGYWSFKDQSPVRAIRLENEDLIVYGGHHRIAVMKGLGETTIPACITYRDDVPQDQLARALGLGRMTGLYMVPVEPPTLSPEMQAAVNGQLENYRKTEQPPTSQG